MSTKNAPGTGAHSRWHGELSDLILPEGLGLWLTETADIDIVIEVLDFLRRHPLELMSLATAARLDFDGGALFYTPNNPRAAELHEAKERWAMEWLASGKLGACPTCVSPVFFFGDGRFLDARPPEHQCKARSHAA